MGLFSSTKKTYVDSVVYNLAGDEDLRPNYMKMTTIRGVLTGSTSLGTTIVSSHLNGPGMNLRSFYKWAEDNYKEIGMPTGYIAGVATVDVPGLITQLPHASNEVVIVSHSEIGEADYLNWVEKYIIENNFLEFAKNWSANIDDQNRITLTYENGSSVVIIPQNFDKKAQYIYATYNTTVQTIMESPVAGDTVIVANANGFPIQSDFTKQYDNELQETANYSKKVTTKVSYSDGSVEPDNVVTTPKSSTYIKRQGLYTYKAYTGRVTEPDGSYYEPVIIYQMYVNQLAKITANTTTVSNDELLPDGRTKTTEVIAEDETFSLEYSYRVDTQKRRENAQSPLKAFLYRIGSGNAVLDAMINNTASAGQFYPQIPIRLDNRFIGDVGVPDAYKEVKKAYKKAMGGAKFDDLVDKLKDNEKLGDIDYAYCVFGVSLNVKENACKKYLYHYFSNMMASQQYNVDDYEDYPRRIDEYAAQMEAYMNWNNHDNGRPSWTDRPPPYPRWPSPPGVNKIVVGNQGRVNINYRTELTWLGIRETVGFGLGKPDAKKGDLWFEVLPDDVFMKGTFSDEGSIRNVTEGVSKIRLYYQDKANSYKYLYIVGMGHTNFVYNGKYVGTSASYALNDPDESGFVVPLHYDTFRSMSLVDSTQMSTACCFIVLNCYKIVKIKWYQKGFFKIFLVIVFAIVAALFTGGAGIGLLGSNLALGASLGFTGLAAGIIGSVVNALAAVILSTVIQTVSGKLFGEQFGALIAAVVSIIAFNVISSFTATGSFSFNWSSLFKADNLMKLMDAGINGYAAAMRGDVLSMQEEGETLMSELEKKQDEIKDLYAKNIGYANENIDPMWLVNSKNYFIESGDTFLTRTLMTGSDIADMSHSLLTDFAELTLKLPTAYS